MCDMRKPVKRHGFYFFSLLARSVPRSAISIGEVRSTCSEGLRVNGFCTLIPRFGERGQERVTRDSSLSKMKSESTGAGAGTQDSVLIPSLVCFARLTCLGFF